MARFDWDKYCGGELSPVEAVKLCKRDGITFQGYAESFAEEYPGVFGEEAPGTLIEGMVHEMNRANTQECAYCGYTVQGTEDDPTPTIDDDDSWECLAVYHEASCEWIETRAHRRTQKGGRYTIDSVKLAHVIDIADVSESKAMEYIDYDWSNGAEHQEWLNSAPAEEIANWLQSCLIGQ